MTEFDLTNAFDGNAFSIIGYTMNAMKQCKFAKCDIDQYKQDVMSDNYDYLVQVSARMIDKCNSVLRANELKDSMFDYVYDWFSCNCDEDSYNSADQRRSDMKAMVDHNNKFMLHDAIDYLLNYFDKTLIDSMTNDIEDYLAQLADDELN